MNPISHRRLSAYWSSSSLRNARKMKPPWTGLISVHRILHLCVTGFFFPQRSFNLDHHVTNNLRVSALRLK